MTAREMILNSAERGNALLLKSEQVAEAAAWIRDRMAIEEHLLNRYLGTFQNYEWTDAHSAIDLMHAEVLTLRKEMAALDDSAAEDRICLGPEIRSERARQDAQWGGPAHDDEHERYDWPHFIVKFTQRAMASAHVDDAVAILSYESAMVKVAALAIAAIQSSRRKRGCQPPAARRLEG